MTIGLLWQDENNEVTFKGMEERSSEIDVPAEGSKWPAFNGPLYVAMATHFGNSHILSVGKQGAECSQKGATPFKQIRKHRR